MLELRSPLQVGTALHVNVRLDSPAPVSLLVTVVWSTQAAVGVRFETSAGPDVLRLERWHHRQKLMAERRAS
jgi:hypothetical protein